MMLNNLKKELESEKNNKNILDIIIYGSVMKGTDKPGDIDIIVVFESGTLKERLDEIQKIKKKIKIDKPFDIKQMLLKDFLSNDFLARTGILIEGKSLFTAEHVSLRFGFKSFALFSYSLKGLTHTKKIQFGYILSGRYCKGVLNELKAERIGSGVIKVPIESSNIFEEIFNQNKILFQRKNILEQI